MFTIQKPSTNLTLQYKKYYVIEQTSLLTDISIKQLKDTIYKHEGKIITSITIAFANETNAINCTDELNSILTINKLGE